MTRKPIAVVKSVLHRNCSDLPSHLKLTHLNDDDNWCDYAPFGRSNPHGIDSHGLIYISFPDGPDASALLGFLDSSFLVCYAIAMFFSGMIAERVSLRYFLSLGMLSSGFFCYAFGYAKTNDIHSMLYFVVVQGLAGIFQTTGWPGVVTVVSRWCGKSKRGLIFGIWNSHTSIGNMLGTYIAAHFVDSDWSMSFIVPGFIMGIVGFVIFMFLVDSPDLVGMQHEVSASNPDPATNYRRIDDSDESDVEPDALARAESGEQVSSCRFLCCVLSFFLFNLFSHAFSPTFGPIFCLTNILNSLGQ
jgi:MFS transporter, OPA family, solute carrier family 37 (glycerol-3-phosphate transporter), member 1/2